MIEDNYSKKLYDINRQYLNCKFCLEQQNKKKLNLKNISIFLRLIFNGGLIRTFLRLFKKNKNVEDKKNNVTDFEVDSSARVAVYTVIFGKYDNLIEPCYVNPNVDYYVITDGDVDPFSVWKKISLDCFKEIKDLSPVEKNRFFKILPHRFLPNYEYSIYVDGNVAIITDVLPLIAELNGKNIGIHRYPTNCIYQMKSAIIAGKRAKKENVNKDIKKYKKEGFPRDFGAFECNVIVRKHNQQECILIMEEWWKEFLSSASKRDQLSLPYVLWKLGYTADFICSLGTNVNLNPRFQIQKHTIK